MERGGKARLPFAARFAIVLFALLEPLDASPAIDSVLHSLAARFDELGPMRVRSARARHSHRRPHSVRRRFQGQEQSAWPRSRSSPQPESSSASLLSTRARTLEGTRDEEEYRKVERQMNRQIDREIGRPRDRHTDK